MKLASTVQPGTYNFICLFHGPEMRGKMTVVEAREKVASPDEVKAQAADQLNKLVQSMQSVVGQAKAAASAAGGTVTWQIVAGHTISFNASDAVDFVVKATDGSFHLNHKAVFPVSWPGQPLLPFPGMDAPPGVPPPPLPPATIPPPPFSADAGVWEGKGFRSSGLLFQQGPTQLVTSR